MPEMFVKPFYIFTSSRLACCIITIKYVFVKIFNVIIQNIFYVLNFTSVKDRVLVTA